MPTTGRSALIRLPGLVPLTGRSYAHIDQHALQAPASVKRSVQSLAAYLCELAKTDLEKVRAIYRWIAANITYDTEGYLDKNRRHYGPEETLSRGCAVCAGYAGLFAQLAHAAGVQVREISGWAKGIGYRPGDPIGGPTNHSWNAVRLDGQYRLIDSTWGAGYVDERMRFVRRFEDHYFLTPPEQLIYSHFPEESAWQLLTKPYSRAEFEALPHTKPAFFRCGLRFGSHRQAVISAASSFSLNLVVPEGIVLLVDLEQDGRKLPDELVFAQRQGADYEVSALFPRPGTYVLGFYVRARADQGPYDWALDYKVLASQGQSDRVSFPKTYSTTQEEGVYLYGPRAGSLQAGTLQTFKLSVPRALDVAVIAGGQWHHLTKNGFVFEGRARVTSGEVQVSARFPDDTQYWTVLRYMGC